VLPLQLLDVTSGQAVLVVAVLGAVGFGLWRAATDGRFRGTHQVRGVVSTGSTSERPSAVAGHGIALGERATLLQFSSAFCAPCRATRRVLADIADVVPGVLHVEIDAEHHLALVRELGILRTPTTLVLDAHGREVRRAAGAPRKEAVLGALSEAIS
jgi:thiol-disulfide isomerase/thioredoxin